MVEIVYSFGKKCFIFSHFWSEIVVSFDQIVINFFLFWMEIHCNCPFGRSFQVKSHVTCLILATYTHVCMCKTHAQPEFYLLGLMIVAFMLQHTYTYTCEYLWTEHLCVMTHTFHSKYSVCSCATQTHIQKVIPLGFKAIIRPISSQSHSNSLTLCTILADLRAFWPLNRPN